MLLFCNHLFALQIDRVSPSVGGTQDQAFRITLDQPARTNPQADLIPTAAFEIIINFDDGDGGNVIHASHFSAPYRFGDAVVFELTPINGSMQGGLTYAREWEFTVPANMMATWEARSNAATTQFRILYSFFDDAAGGILPEYSHPFTFRDDVTDLTSLSTIQAVTAQAQLASQLSTQTVRTTSHRLHFLRRERHAKRRSGSRNKLDSQNRFTQGLKVHFANPDIDHLVRRAVIANQMNASPTGDTWRLFRENITEKIKTWSPWLSGQITVGESKDDANGGDWDIRIRELSYGMDRAIGDHRVGLSLGFATDKADNDAFRVKGRHYTLAGYGAYTLSQGDQWHQYLHGVLGVGWLDSDIRRTQSGVAYEGDRDGLNQLLSLSYLLEVDRGGFTLSPYLRYDRSAIRLDKYTESAGSDALGYEKQKLDAEYLSAGLTVDTVTGYRSGTLKPYAQLEYRHDVSAYDDSVSYRISDPASRNTLDGEKRAPRQWLAGLGLRYQRDAFDVDVRYEHAQSTNHRDDRDSVELKLRWAF